MRNMQEKTFSYKIVRSNRKTMAIHVTKAAEVEVRAPFHVKDKEIKAFVNQKQDWIHKHLIKIKEAQEKRQAFVISYGSPLRLVGKEYILRERAGNGAGFDGQCFYLPANLSDDMIKQALIQVYVQLAKQILTSRTKEYAKITGWTPTWVKVNHAKTRWGSCCIKGHINYSWRLIMAPEEVIDYVVVHELAHLQEMNHSPKYWAEVASVMPDYKERQKKLKEFQRQIADEDWS